MTRATARWTTCARQKGVSLIEAMVAFVIAGFGMLAMVGVQTTLRDNADASKQRTEALRLGQQRLELLRGFKDLTEYAAIRTNTDAPPAMVTVGNAQYQVTETVTPLSSPPRLELTVRVAWQDRYNPADMPNAVLLPAILAGVDPVLSGWLTAPLPPLSRVQPLGRHPSIPLQAVDFGDGRSGFVPPGGDATGVAWMFNNKTGLVTVCAVAPGTLTVGLTVAGLVSCGQQTGYLVSGYVRFATGTAALTAADAEQPGSLALDLSMVLTPAVGSSAGCYDDAPAGPTLQTTAAYYCVVYGASDTGRWSGRVDVLAGSGWTTTPERDDSHKVCRYTADYDGKGGITNDEHPASYTGVAANLVNQNFLVIRAANSCPSDVPADPGRGDLVNSNTVLHAPVS